ncbi:DUF5362 family protein [Luteimonas sp. RD2P54]|uniref:DUF5362 family protein n=1 Tax=Luteimonas endophytica TaxID=3042023 RepID=A0ABT6JA13_9GAMM|nr:DUF5362 family protein [Luteimonas endophytica]MDH5823033.1 DUF5362 family protein [Luteimonas endophytica]
MQTDSNAVGAVMAPLVNGKLWLKLLGVVMIISGALQVLTIVGILWAWIPIWLGVLLFQAAAAAEQAVSSGDAATAARATDKLRLFFMIQGIMLLVALLAMGAMFALGGFAMLAGLAGAGNGW